jgi:hypothetical protein
MERSFGLGLRPIFDGQSWNDDEVAKVAGDDRSAVFESNGGNAEIVGTDIELSFGKVVVASNGRFGLAEDLDSGKDRYRFGQPIIGTCELL